MATKGLSGRFSMNMHKVSTKLSAAIPVWKKVLPWILLFYGCALLYYLQFFSLALAIALSLYMTSVGVAMLWVGYRKLGQNLVFPIGVFLKWSFSFAFVRFLLIYTFLQYHMPSYTVFHYPNRALGFVIGSSAIFVFLGYSYAVYLWGVAARNKARELSGQWGNACLHTIKCNGQTVRLSTADITFLQAKGEYVAYQTTHGEYLCYQRLKDAVTSLERNGFMRTHRSYVVNMGHILATKTAGLVLRNGQEIPMSKTYKEAIMQKFTAGNTEPIMTVL